MGKIGIGDRVLRAAPLKVAVILALFSVLPVTWSLVVPPDPSVLSNEGTSAPPIDWRPMSVIQAFALALLCLVPTAVFAGAAGGWGWRLHKVSGSILALSVGWAAGVILLPLVAALLDVPLRTGIHCLMSCEVMLRDDQPLSGVSAYARALTPNLPGLLAIIPGAFLALSIRWRGLYSSILFAIATHATLHASMLTSTGALVPYLCLVTGVVAWSIWLWRQEVVKAKAYSTSLA